MKLCWCKCHDNPSAIPKPLKKRFVEDPAAARALRSLARWARRERLTGDACLLADRAEEVAKKLEGRS